MTQLTASLRDRELTPAMAQARGDCYRQALARLTDEQWAYAVSESLRLLDWFPTIHELLDFAADAPPTAVHGLLPEKTPEQRELEREQAKAVYERIRPRLVEIGLVDAIKPIGTEITAEEWERRRQEQLRRFRESGESAHTAG
jgi:hypothetical protein